MKLRCHHDFSKRDWRNRRMKADQLNPASCGVLAIDRNPNKARRLALPLIRCLLIGCCAISPNVRAQGAYALSHGTVGHILPNERGRDLFG